MAMRNTRIAWALTLLIGLVIAWTTAGGAVRAQTGSATQAPAAGGPPPARTLVTTTQVKPDMVDAYVALIQKEAIPALKKTGLAWRWTFASGPVGPGFTFVTAQPIQNYAQFDKGPRLREALGPEGLAQYNAKLRPMLVSTSSMIETLVPSASILGPADKPPAWIIRSTLEVLPGRGQEWTQITRDEFLPALKKAGVTDSWVFATNFGGSPAQRSIVTPIANWAQLDTQAPLIRAIGAEAAQKLNLKRNALTTNPEVTIWRYVPELSYGMPPRQPSSGQ